MDNFILITYNPTFDNEILKDRIKNLGSHYNYFQNNWVIKTKLTTKEVYEQVVSKDFEKLSILVLELHITNLTGYWGRMDSGLWNWIKNQ